MCGGDVERSSSDAEEKEPCRSRRAAVSDERGSDRKIAFVQP